MKRLLGEGGMATVYVAEQEGEPREIALKILRPELTSDKTFAKRFEREAKAAARVQHPNSVTILDAGVSGRWSYIAMELLRGDDLYVLLERHRVLSPKAAATIVAEVCDALAVAHGLGIVHRDLKPENIMIVRDPVAEAEPFGPKSAPLPIGSQVKVLDFGIAKLLDKQADAPARPAGDRLDPPSAMTSVTRAGTLIGTPAYMSPEQCSLLAVDTRSDIYTCGVLLFQMITGRLPFEGPTALHIAMKHIHEEPPTLRSLIPHANEALDAVIRKALSKRPSERQPTARNLAGALRRLIPTLPDVPYVATSDVVELSSEAATTDPISVDILAMAPPSEMISSAKTVVAEGLSGPPPSVLVRKAAEPPRQALMVLARHSDAAKSAPTEDPITEEEEEPLGEADPEDLAATLVRGHLDEAVDDLAQTQQAAGLHAGRNMTMQSTPAPAAGGRVPKISVIAPEGPPATSRLSDGPMPIPIGQAPREPVASVILAPSISERRNAMQPQAGPTTEPVPALGFVASTEGAEAGRGAPPAPTFGLPPTGPLSTAAPVNRRALWLGILIGTIASAVMFAIAYALLLSR